MKTNLLEINSRHAVEFSSGWPADCRIYFSIRQRQQAPHIAISISVTIGLRNIKHPLCRRALKNLHQRLQSAEPVEGGCHQRRRQHL